MSIITMAAEWRYIGIFPAKAYLHQAAIGLRLVSNIRGKGIVPLIFLVRPIHSGCHYVLVTLHSSTNVQRNIVASLYGSMLFAECVDTNTASVVISAVTEANGVLVPFVEAQF